MTTDGIVQTEQVSTGEPVSSEAQVSPEGEKQPEIQPFTPEQEAKLQQIVTEAASRAAEVAKEAGKREMQGIKDREVAEAKKAARLAESRAKIYESSFEGLDEDTRKDVELARLRGESQYHQTARQEEEKQKAQEAYFDQLNKSLVSNLESLGINPKDERVDWAQDAPYYIQGRSRFDSSVAKILKENELKRIKEIEDKAKAAFDEMERKLRVELGLESHDTSMSGGGTRTFTAAEIAAMSLAEYEKVQGEIIKAQKEGKIKR